MEISEASLEEQKRWEKAFKQRVYREKKRSEKELCDSIVETAKNEAKEIVERAQQAAKDLEQLMMQNAENLRVATIEESDMLIRSAKAEKKALMEQGKRKRKRWQEREKNIANREEVLVEKEMNIASRIAELSIQEEEQGIEQPDAIESRAQQRANGAARQRSYYARRQESKQQLVQQEVNEAPSSSTKSRTSMYRVCKGLVDHFNKITIRLDLSTKKTVLDHFWKHPSLSSLRPDFLAKPGMIKTLSAGIKDAQIHAQRVKYAKRNDQRISKRTLVMAFSGDNVVRGRHKSNMSKLLGLKRSNLDQGAKLRQLWDSETATLESLWVRKTRKDKVSFEVEQIVQQFWERTTRVSPNMRDNVRQRVSQNLYNEHRTHWLEESQVEFFLRYEEWVKQPEQTQLRERLQLGIGLRTFEKLKPYFVRVLKDMIVCCCKQHVEMDYFKVAFNKMTIGLHAVNCCCECDICRPQEHDWGNEEPHCIAYVEPITSIRAWCDTILCPNYIQHDSCCICECVVCKPEFTEWGTSEPQCVAYDDPSKSHLCHSRRDNAGNLLRETYHKKECLMGNCPHCGITKLPICESELDRSGDINVEWKAFQYTTLEKKGPILSRARTTQMRTAAVQQTEHVVSGKEGGKRLSLVDKQTPFSAFLEKLTKSMPLFVRHNFRYRWQADAYRQCLAKFSRRCIVSTIDYAENYTFNVQNEVQSMHWVKKQITILVHITYRHRDDQELGVFLEPDAERHVIADYHFYISDDLEHDSLFVQYCFDLHYKWMTDLGVQYDFHYVWSDGCAAQFKSARPFYFVSRHASTYGPLMMWNFFGSGHGKGVQDGLGGHVKSALAKEQLKLTTESHRLDNAADAVSFLQKRFAVGKDQAYGEVQEVNRHFHLIGKNDVDRTKRWDCSAIEGTRQLHCFYGFNRSNPIQLKVRELSCFCDNCVALDFEQCVGSDYSGPWDMHTIIPAFPSEVIPVLKALGTGENMGEEEDTWEGGQLGELLEVGDYYAIEAATPNKWDVLFYVLHCVKPMHTITTTFTDAYEQSFIPGQHVVEGKWYQPWGKKGSIAKYVEVKSSATSFCLVESVIHIRFPLIPSKKLGKDALFTIESETTEAILAALD